jgi:hypothetical protein
MQETKVGVKPTERAMLQSDAGRLGLGDSGNCQVVENLKEISKAKRC